MRFFMSLLVICVLLSGCEDSKVIHSAETVSPDGAWRAVAKTTQYDGPGTAGLITAVSLQRTNSSKSATDILVFEQADLNGFVLNMNWEDATHLHVTFHGAQLDFQAIKCGGIAISTQDI